MSPMQWAALHPWLLASLMLLSAIAGGILTCIGVLFLAPDTDTLRQMGQR